MCGRAKGWLVLGAGVAGLAALIWVAGRRPAAAEPAAALPYLWQWQLNHAPVPPGGGTLSLVLRSRADPVGAGGAMPPARHGPLAPGEGEDEQVLVAESLAGVRPDQFRVGFQFVDLRAMGVHSVSGEPPLRFVAGYETGSGIGQHPVLAGGYSFRSAVPHPADRWEGDELPLLTLVTFDQSRQFTYTLLLAVRPVDS